MSHRRSEIRGKVVEILKFWDALQEIPILNGKRYPIPMENLPVVVVSMSEELSQESSRAPREFRKTARLEISVFIQAQDEFEDSLDDLTREIENALNCDESLGNLINRHTLLKTEISSSDSLERIVGMAQMTYEIDYYSQANWEYLDKKENVKKDLRQDSQILGILV